jgi:hypothetical protein
VNLTRRPECTVTVEVYLGNIESKRRRRCCGPRTKGYPSDEDDSDDEDA